MDRAADHGTTSEMSGERGTRHNTTPDMPNTTSGGYEVYRSPRRLIYSDRFIPSRAASSRLDYSLLERETAAAEAPKRVNCDKEDSNGAYSMLLRTELLGCPPVPSSPEKSAVGTQLYGSPLRGPSSSKLLRFVAGDDETPVAGPPPQSPYDVLGGGDNDASTPSPFASPSRLPRKIARTPFKVLDAPSLADDFYLNLVDWSSKNVLAVGLGSCVYLWSACTSKVTRVVDYGESSAVCSVGWSPRGCYLSVGTDRGEVQVWDAEKCRKIRTMTGHKQRVGCMSWNHNVLATGSRDRQILLRDVRAPEQSFAKLNAHRSEVCGLKWSSDDRELASGGNDNLLMIWSPGGIGGTSGMGYTGTGTGSSTHQNLQNHHHQPFQRFNAHQAAVKAIAWSPHQHGLVASGGGTADRCIKFWNTSTGQMLHSVDTGSQVCNLSWSKNVNELVSTHGYSQNQIVVWRYPSLQKLATLTGHTMRVLYLAVSPDGQTIVTGAGDETLRFWNVFPGPKAFKGGDTGMGSMSRMIIR